MDFFSFLRHSSLIIRMTKHQILAKYRGSIFGLLWSIALPILMLATYTFVFGFVFQARWGQSQIDSNPFEFAVIMFAGLIIFNLFSECIAPSPGLITSNVNFVKKVIFPLEILPIITLGVALFHATISLAVLLLFLFLLDYAFSWSMLWLPIIIMPLLLLILGFSWFLASIGVFIRDISQVIGMLLTMVLFLCPIFYPLSSSPVELRGYLIFNPLTIIVEQVRTILIWGEQPDWALLSIYSIVSLTIAICGLFWFKKTRKGFADVL